MRVCWTSMDLIPDLSTLSQLRYLELRFNELGEPIPDLNAFTNLTTLLLGFNRLTGPIQDLDALSKLDSLDFSYNQLSGPFPELSALTELYLLDLGDNELSGPIPDLGVLTNLRELDLSNNDLSGPVPDLSALRDLSSFNLTGNRFCLTSGAGLSHSNNDVAARLNSLILPNCTDAELAAVPGVPQNLTGTVGAGQVALSWDAVTDAANYDLWAWDSLDRRWGAVSDLLDGRSYSHPVLDRRPQLLLPGPRPLRQRRTRPLVAACAGNHSPGTVSNAPPVPRT